MCETWFLYICWAQAGHCSGLDIVAAEPSQSANLERRVVLSSQMLSFQEYEKSRRLDTEDCTSAMRECFCETACRVSLQHNIAKLGGHLEQLSRC